MGKVMAMKQGDKLPTAREPLRVFPYVYKGMNWLKCAGSSLLQYTSQRWMPSPPLHSRQKEYICRVQSALARHGRRSVLVRAKKELDVGQAVSSGRFILSATKSAAQDRHAPSNL